MARKASSLTKLKTETKSSESGKSEAVNIAMQQIERNFGKGSIMKLGESLKNMPKVPVVSTGSLSLNLALGIGGYPRGRIIEIYGPEASGKTTLCLHAIAEVQKHGGTAAFIDVEHALDPVRAEKIGVNLEELLISQPDYGEQALEIAETLVRSGGVDIVVVDSVAALVPKSEIEGEMGDHQMGTQARLMSQAMRKLTAAISKANTLMIFTNQIRMKIGVMFGSPETTSGGNALKFYASQRLDIRKIGNIQEGEEIVGSRHRVKVKKNKIAPPFKVAEFDMDDNGISREGDVVDMGADKGVLEKSGSFYKYKGEVLAQGREAAKVKLAEEPALRKEIEKKIWEVIQAK
ncbi:MAG: recombinase RecA [Candidatus Pacebacteria bacterium RIFOXYB1_FULL_39_46]|nr:MAG: recombinase RecA [Candidatus Pacebacteria bacterium RIFOXYB1_FULL_39_46]OGJ39065.1 MAG: recombinase RecA [Candidatus Pacebacteria bacterium RIFOXYA1_FULL_38_18]OGJ39590.1 MAG: recombinase RecA [Candidatus Pacebacteria bacterium RIFOXYD1_FULL_39_27]OGJ40702.1 MAG: recombinase RecA [Candidatus Pacebacteria bacterium RIFOXYC1_FULL_39_21]